MGDQYLYGEATPAGPHAVTSIKKAGALIGSYSYDANGNLRTGGGRSLSYTSFNLPSAITQGTATASFTYDADHARATQVAGGETTVYLNPRWDDGIHYEKTTKTGGLIEHRHYLYADTTPIALYTTRSDNTSSTRYLHKDHLGSVDAITNETGALAERLSYDAWGERRQGNWLDASAPITGATTHHGYTGHEHLDGLGLIHMNARVYDPAIGRFLQADPIGFEGGLNLYGYAEGNPTSWVDLSGQETGYVSNCSQRGTCTTPQTSFNVAASIIDFFTGSNVNRISIGCCGPQFDRPVERLTPELLLLMPIRAGMFASGVASTTGRDALIAESRAQSAYLSDKYGALTAEQRSARIEELAMSNRVLRGAGVPPQYISEALQSFEPGTIGLRIAGESDFGLRLYGGVSGPKSPYVGPTFPLGDARSLNAVVPGNTLQNIAQWQIRPGTPFLEGRIRGAFGQPGGGMQWYVPDFRNNLLTPSRF